MHKPKASRDLKPYSKRLEKYISWGDGLQIHVRQSHQSHQRIKKPDFYQFRYFFHFFNASGAPCSHLLYLGYLSIAWLENSTYLKIITWVK